MAGSSLRRSFNRLRQKRDFPVQTHFKQHCALSLQVAKNADFQADFLPPTSQRFLNLEQLLSVSQSAAVMSIRLG